MVNLRRSSQREIMMAIAAMLALGIAPLRAGAAACPATISKCCKITSAGSYTVPTSGFSTSATGVCIDIVASDVILAGIPDQYGNPPTITGPGDTTSSTGIVIEATAPKAIVSELVISDFGLGMAINGRRATLLEVLTNFNGRGKLINAARAYLNFGDAGDNQSFGIRATVNAADLTIVQTFSRNNGGAGFRLRNLVGAHLNGDLADNNGTFGFWLDGASGNSIVSFEANNNSIAGVYLGCDSAGPNGVPCPWWRTPSNGNLISGVWVVSNASAAETDSVASASSTKPIAGVAIDAGSVGNLVTMVTAKNPTLDMLDENRHCASNMWELNTFTTSSPAKSTTPYCIN